MSRLNPLFAALAVSALAGAAYADIGASKALVDAAKAKGVVGEQADGYLGFVAPSGDAALQAAVSEINAGRAQVYRQTAAANGVAPGAAGAAAFNAIFNRMPPGQYYRTSEGVWKRK